MAYGRNYNIEYIDKTIGENTYTFVCEFLDSRDGFSHACELRKNGRRINYNRVHYLNRTWEAYRYQSVMLGCVRNELDYIMDEAKADYKKAHNLSRLVGKRKEEVETATKNSKEYAEMKLLYKMVQEAHYGSEAEREELEQLDKLVKLTEALFGKDGLLRKDA